MKTNVTIANWQIAIFTVFLAAKLGGDISWEWWVVFSPLWIVIPIMLLGLFIGLTVVIFTAIVDKIIRK